MKYVCLIYEDPTRQPAPGADRDAIMKAYWQFTEEVQGAGKMVDGNPLEPVTTATTLRVRDGETLTTDGPFAETKEFLGGYYVLDCENLDEALAWAAKIPGVHTGSVEVRPVANIM
jgi:hypothetical protein